MRGCRSLKVTSAEKARLNQRLRQLDLGVAPHHVEKMSHARRPYPQVFPKYRNPAEPTETWATETWATETWPTETWPTETWPTETWPTETWAGREEATLADRTA